VQIVAHGFVCPIVFYVPTVPMCFDFLFLTHRIICQINTHGFVYAIVLYVSTVTM